MWSEAVQSGCLAWVDVAFADLILQEANDPNSKAFICHLSKCAREGHLCVHVKEGQITPSPEEVWFADLSEPPTEKLRILVEGISSFKLPDHVVADVKNDSEIPMKPICRNGHHYYFQKYWLFESQFIKDYHRLVASKPDLLIDSDEAKRHINDLVKNNQLNAEQANAILQACLGSFTIICGGPGTGKTYTAGHLIDLFLKLINRPFEIALAAPTGKAASNLQKSFQKSNIQSKILNPNSLKITDPQPNTPHPNPSKLTTLQSKTLHSLLGIRSQKQIENRFLTADLILVDESSMIDVRLMSQLFASIKTGARLILLGDPYQLPPVEAGALFTDLIDLSKGVSRLKTCLRAELEEMIDFASCVNRGSVSETLARLDRGGSVTRLKIETRDNLLNEICSQIPNPDPTKATPEDILNAYHVYRVLSPLRRGPFGIDEMNSKIHQIRRQEYARSAPIMIIQNDYRMGLFNGEVGVLIFDPNGVYAIFYGPDGVRKISTTLLPKFEYAYCLSVHKSQGSEFDHVLLLMPDGAEVFGREVLYTAVTRAKKGLQIWGSDQVLTKTLQKCVKRISGIGANNS